MPQSTETGRQGYKNGYGNADQIGALLGAKRISKNSNEFLWNGKVVVIKTGQSAVVTRAMLAKVGAVVYGEKMGDGWVLYEIDPAAFERLSVRSQSNNHDENYRLVRRSQIKDNGTIINV